MRPLKIAWLGTASANGAILVSGMLTGILAARLLGPEDRGLLAALMFWPAAIAGLTSLSVSEAIVARRAKIRVPLPCFVASGVALSLMLALAAVGLGWLALPRLLGPDRAASHGTAFLYLVAQGPVAGAAGVLLALDQAEQRFARVSLLRLGPSWIYLLGILLLWLLGAISAEALLWAALAGSVLTVLARLAIRARDLVGVPDIGEMRALFRLGLRFHAHAVLFLLASQADRMVLLLAFSDADVGHYVVATTFAQSGLAAVTNAVSFVLFPAMAAEPDRARAQALLALWLRRTALFLYLGVAASLVVTPWLLPFLFGPAFTDAVPIAAILLLAMIPLSLRQTIIRCLRAFGEARIGVTSEGTSLAVFALAAGPSLLAWGPTGIAGATLLGQLAGLFVCARHLASRHGIVWGKWLLPGRDGLADALAIGRGLVTRGTA